MLEHGGRLRQAAARYGIPIEDWISVKALREIEQPKTPKQKLPVQPEGTAEVDVTRELNKLLPAEARAIDRDPAKAPCLCESLSATLMTTSDSSNDSTQCLMYLTSSMGWRHE